MKILIVIFPQRSHVNAIFSLADRLRSAGHDVVFTGAKELRQYVIALGFGFIERKVDVYSFVENRDPARANSSGGFLGWVSMILHYDRYRRQYLKMGGLSRIVETANPDCILIDRAYSAFAPSILRMNIPFAIIVSMGNLSHSWYAPPQDTSFTPSPSLYSFLCVRFHWFRYYLIRRISRVTDFRLEFDEVFLRMAERESGRSKFRFDRNRYFHVGISEVPEFLIFPQEFDIPRRLLPNQYHIGPFAEPRQSFSVYSLSFDGIMRKYSMQRSNGRPLILCVLGTAMWRYKHIKRFVGILIAISKCGDWNLIVAGNRNFVPDEGRNPAPNIALIKEIPQQVALAQSDLMVSHGGMNSIVEAIMAGVPMLICPGMKNSDQPGNAARVVYHEIGMKVNSLRVTPRELAKKIEKLLTSPGYRERVNAMRNHILLSEAQQNPERIFERGFQSCFKEFKYSAKAPDA